MANPNKPYGFTPVGCMSGADWHGKLREVCFLATDNTACFIGDIVKLTGDASPDGLYPAVTQSSAGDGSVGVLVELDPAFKDESSLSAPNYRRAGTFRTGRVAWGSDVLYSAQEDSVGGAIAVTAVGGNINFLPGTGNTITGISGAMLDSSTVATTNTLPLRLHKLEPSVGNAVGDYAQWIVSLNTSQDTNTTGV